MQREEPSVAERAGFRHHTLTVPGATGRLEVRTAGAISPSTSSRSIASDPHNPTLGFAARYDQRVGAPFAARPLVKRALLHEWATRRVVLSSAGRATPTSRHVYPWRTNCRPPRMMRPQQGEAGASIQ